MLKKLCPSCQISSLNTLNKRCGPVGLFGFSYCAQPQSESYKDCLKVQICAAVWMICILIVIYSIGHRVGLIELSGPNDKPIAPVIANFLISIFFYNVWLWYSLAKK